MSGDQSAARTRTRSLCGQMAPQVDILGQVRCQGETGQGGLEDKGIALNASGPSARTFPGSSRPFLENGQDQRPPRRGQSQIDACVSGQVMGGVWPGPPGEVGGRADEHLSEVRPNAQGDHILGDLFTQAHACVEAFGDNIGQAVVVDDLNPDVRVIR